jgi:hypothetical protein
MFEQGFGQQPTRGCVPVRATAVPPSRPAPGPPTADFFADDPRVPRRPGGRDAETGLPAEVIENKREGAEAFRGRVVPLVWLLGRMDASRLRRASAHCTTLWTDVRGIVQQGSESRRCKLHGKSLRGRLKAKGKGEDGGQYAFHLRPMMKNSLPLSLQLSLHLLTFALYLFTFAFPPRWHGRCRGNPHPEVTP